MNHAPGDLGLAPLYRVVYRELDGVLVRLVYDKTLS